MEPGLYLIQIQLTYRLHGDEYEFAPGARVVTRARGQEADWNGPAQLAEEGPGKRYKLHKPMLTSEPMHRVGMA